MNKDWKTRDKILKPYFNAYKQYCKENLPYAYECLQNSDVWEGDLKRFKLMPVQALQHLIELGFADPENDQNGSPSIAQMVSFMNRWPRFVFAHGYAVHYSRDDYRISVEGVEGKVPEDLDKKARSEFVIDFLRFWTGADEMELNNNGNFRVWYD